MIHTSFLFIQCKTISCYRLRLKQSRKYLKTQWNWFCTRLNLCLFRWFCSQKVDFLHKTVDFVSDSVPFSKARLVFWSYHMFCDHPDKPWGTGDIGQTIGPIRCWDADAGSVPEPDAVCIPYIRETVVAAASTNRSRDRRQVRRNYI